MKAYVHPEGENRTQPFISSLLELLDYNTHVVSRRRLAQAEDSADDPVFTCCVNRGKPACLWYPIAKNGTRCFPSVEVFSKEIYQGFDDASEQFGKCNVDGDFSNCDRVKPVDECEQFCEGPKCAVQTLASSPGQVEKSPSVCITSNGLRPDITSFELIQLLRLTKGQGECGAASSYIGYNSTMDCQNKWGLLATFLGCQTCIKNIAVLKNLHSICRAATTENDCKTTTSDTAAKEVKCNPNCATSESTGAISPPTSPGNTTTPVGTPNTPPIPAPTSTPKVSAREGKNRKKDAMIIIGAVVAGIAAAVVFSILAIFCYCRTKQNHDEKTAAIMKDTQAVVDSIVSVRKRREPSIGSLTESTMSTPSHSSKLEGRSALHSDARRSLHTVPLVPVAEVGRSNALTMSGSLPDPHASGSGPDFQMRALQGALPVGLTAAPGALPEERSRTLPLPLGLEPAIPLVGPPQPWRHSLSDGQYSLPIINGMHMYDKLLETSDGSKSSRSFGQADRTRRKLVAAVHHSLDTLRDSTAGAFDEYVLEVNEPRHTGEHSVVALAKHAATGAEVAVKFFVHGESLFYKEMAVYEVTRSPGRNQADFILGGKDNSETVFPKNRRTSSYIVMARGTSLREWMRINPPSVTVLWLLHDLSTQLALLHEAGYVHRDVRPANIIWVPSQSSWRLIDFAATSLAGAQLPPAAQLRFSAPEIVQHDILRQHTRIDRLKAHSSVDVWALGVMAFELMSGETFFPHDATKEVQTAMLVGEKSFKHERDLSMWAVFGPLQTVIRRMVSKEARLRPPVSELQQLLKTLTSGSRKRSQGSFPG